MVVMVVAVVNSCLLCKVPESENDMVEPDQKLFFLYFLSNT